MWGLWSALARTVCGHCRFDPRSNNAPQGFLRSDRPGSKSDPFPAGVVDIGETSVAGCFGHEESVPQEDGSTVHILTTSKALQQIRTDVHGTL